MTNPGLGQSLLDLADKIEKADYVDPRQAVPVLRRVGHGIDREIARLHARIDALEARSLPGNGQVGLGTRAPCRDD